MRRILPLILLVILVPGSVKTFSMGERPDGFHVRSLLFDLYTSSLSKEETAILGREARDACESARSIFSCQTRRSLIIRVLPPGAPLPEGGLQRYEIVLAHSESLPHLRYELRYRVYDIYLREYLLLTRSRERERPLPGTVSRELLARAAASHNTVTGMILKDILSLHEDEEAVNGERYLARVREIARGREISVDTESKSPVSDLLEKKDFLPGREKVRVTIDGRRIAWKEGGLWKRTPILPLDSLHAPHRGEDGSIWFLARRGGDKGLYLYRPESGRLKFLASDILYFLPGEDGTLFWGGGKSGQHVLKMMQDESIVDLLETSSRPLGLARFSGGRILFLLAGPRGASLYGLDRKKGELLIYEDVPPVSLALGMKNNRPVIWSARENRWIELHEYELEAKKTDTLPAMEPASGSGKTPLPARNDLPPAFLPRKIKLGLDADYKGRFLGTGSIMLGTPDWLHTLQAGGGGGLYTEDVPGGNLFVRYEGGGRRHRGGVTLRSANIPTTSDEHYVPVNRLLAGGNIWQMEAEFYWKWHPVSFFKLKAGMGTRWYLTQGDNDLSPSNNEYGSQVLFSEIILGPFSGLMEGFHLSVTGSGALPLSGDLASWFALHGYAGWNINPLPGFFIHPSLGGGGILGRSRAGYRIPDDTDPGRMAMERLDLALETGYKWILKERYTSWYARSDLSLETAFYARATLLRKHPREEGRWLIETTGRLSFEVVPLIQLSLDGGWLFDTRGVGNPLLRVTMRAVL